LYPNILLSTLFSNTYTASKLLESAVKIVPMVNFLEGNSRVDNCPSYVLIKDYV
jgi:hypothetical protein